MIYLPLTTSDLFFTLSLAIAIGLWIALGKFGKKYRIWALTRRDLAVSWQSADRNRPVLRVVQCEFGYVAIEYWAVYDSDFDPINDVCRKERIIPAGKCLLNGRKFAKRKHLNKWEDKIDPEIVVMS